MKHLLARLSCCFSSSLYKGRGRGFKVKGIEGIGVLFTMVARVSSLYVAYVPHGP